MLETKNRGLFNSIGVIGQSNMLAVVLYSICFILFANMTGFEGVRLVSIALETYIFVSLFLGFAVTKAIGGPLSRLLGRKQFKQARSLTRYACIYSLVVSVIVSLLIYINSEKIATKIFYDKLAVIPLRIICPTIVVSALVGCFKGYFNGYGVNIATALSLICESVTTLIFGVVFTKIGCANGSSIGKLVQDEYFEACYGTCGLLLAFALGQVVSLIALIILFIFSKKYLRHQVGDHGKVNRVSKEHIGTTFLVKLISAIIGVVIFRGFFYISLVMYSTSAANGVPYAENALNITYLFGRIVFMIYIPFSLVKIIFAKVPHFVSTMVNRNEYGAMRKRVRPLMHATFVFIAPIIMWIGCGGSLLEAVLFSKYSAKDTGTIMVIGAVIGLLLSFCYMLYNIAIGLSKTFIFNGIAVLLFGFLIFVEYLFVNVLELGILGILYAILVYGLCFTFAFIFIMERYGFALRNTMLTYLPALGASVAVGVIQFGISRLLVPIAGGMISLVVSIPVCFCIYWLILFILQGTTERELMMIPGGKFISTWGKMVGLL